MTHQLTRVPALIRLSNPLANALLRVGMPMGPNSLVTIRGRTSGRPISMPIAVMEMDDRRWVIGAYGDVQWTRNLRAAGEADVEVHGRTVHVAATELQGDEAEQFFGETLPTYVRRFPPAGRLFARVFFRIIDREITTDPRRAAAKHPVFELREA
jgi:deazaflavin-dependent oxidoreductase (nitroreductase family)